MLPTRRELLRLAGSSGFEAATLEKVLRLGAVLAEIVRHGRLSTGLCDFSIAAFDEPVLVAGDRPTGEEIRTAAWSVVEPLLDLAPEEREYCDRLQVGELSTELLFPHDPELASRVAASPPLRWKAENARQHHSRRKR